MVFHFISQNQKEELERLKRDLRFAEERADDVSRSKGSEVSTLLTKYNRQLEELEASLRVSPILAICNARKWH